MGSPRKLKLCVLGSGRGSNFVAIQDNIIRGNLNAEIVLVLSDKRSRMLELADEYNLPTCYMNPKDYSSRDAFDQACIIEIKKYHPDYIILAGYMRILSTDFVTTFENRILNIHPSLLPAFRGLHPQQQALDAGVKFAGCTVHFVTAELDAGPIIVQDVVPVMDDDEEDSLSSRILEREHKLYSEAIKLLSEQDVVIEGQRVKGVNK